MLEGSIEKYFVNQVKQAGGWPLKLLPNIINGLPDRIVLWPGGKVDFVELKRPGAKPRKLQTITHGKLESLGFRVRVIDTKEAVDTFIWYVI